MLAVRPGAACWSPWAPTPWRPRSRKGRRTTSRRRPIPSRSRSTASAATTSDDLELSADGGGGFGKHPQLAERRFPRQVLHAAVGRHDQALGVDETQRVLDPAHDKLFRL